jgi:FeS assembly SUF system protein
MTSEIPTPAQALDIEQVRQDIIAMLKTCYDPEIPVDIYELGLIYDVVVDEQGLAVLTMTLTSPMCPVAESLPAEVEQKVRTVPGVGDARIDLVWEPKWEPAMMSEAAKLELGF